jgi:hypothetical protein
MATKAYHRSSMAPVRAYILCSGVGHAMRGFETFAVDCFAALRSEPWIELTLVKGRGPAEPDNRTTHTPGRDSAIAWALGRAAGRNGYFAEQMLFGARVIPMLARARPDVLYLSDWALAGALGRWRRLTRQRYRILLCNGAPGTPYFDWSIDCVQHLTPSYYEWLIEHGESPDRHKLLPLGATIAPELRSVSSDEKRALRRQLGLPTDVPLVLTVAALNISSKRLDYVIRESAATSPRPFLAMLGQREDETPAVLEIANSALGPKGFVARTVSPADVADYYRAADVFVLGSEYEASPRVLVEALAHGLPTIAHDSSSIRFVTGDVGILRDLSQSGALANALQDLGPEAHSDDQRRARHRSIYERFSWDGLRPRYVEMLTDAATLPLQAAELRRRGA